MIDLIQRLREILGVAQADYDLDASNLMLTTVITTGALANGAEATIAALDAIGGTRKDVKINLNLDAACAGNITARWYVTSLAAPLTFVLRPIPDPGVAHQPLAATVEMYEFGDLPEGLQLEFRVLSAADDTGVNYEAELTYLA